MAQELPLGRNARRSDDRNDAKLLPELCDGTNDGGFAHFAAERMLQLRDCLVARLELLVHVDGKLRNLPGAGNQTPP